MKTLEIQNWRRLRKNQISNPKPETRFKPLHLFRRPERSVNRTITYFCLAGPEERQWKKLGNTCFNCWGNLIKIVWHLWQMKIRDFWKAAKHQYVIINTTNISKFKNKNPPKNVFHRKALYPLWTLNIVFKFFSG